MLFTARGRAFAARLGLLALALIALAPLASQLRAEPADWSWLSELACHEGAGSTAVVPDGARPVLQVDVCGYCSLFSHCPALADNHWPLAGRLRAAPEPRAALPAQPLPRAHFPRALSRAPPMRA